MAAQGSADRKPFAPVSEYDNMLLPQQGCVLIRRAKSEKTRTVAVGGRNPLAHRTLVRHKTSEAEDKPAKFQGRHKSYLKGVNGSHTAAIEILQPYNGVDWTRRLKAVSNPDKHRHLVVNTHNSGVTGTAGQDPAQVFAPPGVKGLFIIIAVPNPTLVTPMHMQFHITFFIAFDDGMPIIETLEQMHAEVANTLANFKPEFK